MNTKILSSLLIIFILFASLIFALSTLFIESTKQQGPRGDDGPDGEMGPDGIRGDSGEQGLILPYVAIPDVIDSSELGAPSSCSSSTSRIQVQVVENSGNLLNLPTNCATSSYVIVYTYCVGSINSQKFQQVFYGTCSATRIPSDDNNWGNWLTLGE